MSCHEIVSALLCHRRTDPMVLSVSVQVDPCFLPRPCHFMPNGPAFSLVDGSFSSSAEGFADSH